MRAYDWSATPLGVAHTWPQSLRTSVRILLNTNHPMLIWWGPDLIQFYNDAYSRTMGPERHPGALGQRGRACWEEIWPTIGPQIEQVMSRGGANTDVHDQKTIAAQLATLNATLADVCFRRRGIATVSGTCRRTFSS